MKKLRYLSLFLLITAVMPTYVYAADKIDSNAYSSMKAALTALSVIFGILMLASAVFTVFRFQKNRIHIPVSLMAAIYITTVIVGGCTIFSAVRLHKTERLLMNSESVSTEDSNQTETDSSTTESTETTTPPPTEPPVIFSPLATDRTNPDNWGIQWEIISKGTVVDSYERENPIHFGDGIDYSSLEGIITFRGDNYRSGATYGTAAVNKETLSLDWRTGTASLNGWTGSGWTGQPLIVRWDDKTKSIMNLYDSKKHKDNLTEIIYATLDGNIYFCDLDDGSYTRDPIYIGMNFKGAGALDPRGYPLLYVGSGDYIGGSSPRMYIISLIDGKILYQKSGNDAFSHRSWCAFDSSPLVDAETDTLIWPGESGVLYTIHLNTQFDSDAGTISIQPEEIVKTRYATNRSNAGTYWHGYEASAVIVERYLYISENGGMFYCIDLNTMSLVWAQDTQDDSNSTPVFEWGEDGTGYIYTAPSLHWTARQDKGNISIYKLNAQTGEIIWEVPYDCYTVSGVSGGVQATPLLGKPGTDLEGLIVYTVARTPNYYNGVVVALDTQTGEVVWKYDLNNYAWSSPTAIYTDNDKAYVIIGDSAGYLHLLDGATGNHLYALSLGSNIEASPAVFENMIVVGTRGQLICGIKIE